MVISIARRFGAGWRMEMVEQEAALWRWMDIENGTQQTIPSSFHVQEKVCDERTLRGRGQKTASMQQSPTTATLTIVLITIAYFE